MKSRSGIASILAMRCPKCRTGKMFPQGMLYTSSFMKMNKKCACCDQSFIPEPGYYFGAMFVSYAINAAFFIAVWLGLHLLMDTISIRVMIVTLLVVVVGLLPVTFRLSRVLWIYIFVKYQGPVACKD